MLESENSIKAVCLDMDGTMFNTEDIYDLVGQEVLAKRGHNFTNELKMKMMGLPGPKAFQVMKDECQLGDSIDELAVESNEIFIRLLPAQIQKMPGLDELLHAIEGLRLPKAIATSSMLRFAEVALGTFDLRPRFDFVLTSEDVTRGKPHPEIYLNAAKRWNIEPRQMLVVEDSVIGSQAAAASGAVTVAVPGTHSSSGDFSHVDYIADHLTSPIILNLIGAKI